MEIKNHPIFGEIQEEMVSFYFENQLYEARKGQTIASALMRNEIRNLGVSRKLLQSRGIFCNTGRCCSCYVTVDGEEHVKSCNTLVENGMKIEKNMGDPDLRSVSNEN